MPSRIRSALLPVVFSITLVGFVWAQSGIQATQIPPGFAALVPPGAKISAPGFGRTDKNATVKFYALKPVGNEHVQYSFELHCFDDKFWKFLEPNYRKLLEQDSERERKQLASSVRHYSGNGRGSEVYPPEVKEYPWGKGITQRTDQHFVGEISGKTWMVTTYRCSYFGVAGHSTFNMGMSGHVVNLEEANQWAAKVADKAEKTDLGNIGN